MDYEKCMQDFKKTLQSTYDIDLDNESGAYEQSDLDKLWQVFVCGMSTNMPEAATA